MNAADANFAAWLLAAGEDQRAALLHGEDSWTYARLRAAVLATAGDLVRRGVGKGDRVALLGDNSPQWVVWYLGILRAGAVAAPLPTKESPGFLAQALAESQAVLMLCQDKHLEAVRAAAPPTLPVVSDDPEATAGAPAPPPPPSPAAGWPAIGRDDLAALMLTSGSTAGPKCVRVTHGNLSANTRSILAFLPLGSHDRMMVVLPFHYCYGASLLHTHLRVGATLVLNNLFMFPEKVVRALETAECTGFAGVPSTFQTLLRKARLAHSDLSRLRYVLQAGGRLAPTLLGELLALLPSHVRFYVMYGATEATARLSYLPPALLPEKLGSIGIPIPGVTFALLDEAGRPVLDGQVGQLVARGENVTAGYHNAEELTRSRFRDGWLHTGDLAWRDGDGFYYIEGRSSEFIKTYGFRVSPREIEDVLCALPDVVEALVYGEPDSEAGEALAAEVVPRPGADLTEERVRAHCVARLPNHKVPARISLVSELPKNEAGKVLRRRQGKPA